MVETTNFNPQHGFRGAWENLRVTERFAYVDANTIRYRFTIDDHYVDAVPSPVSCRSVVCQRVSWSTTCACHGGTTLQGVLSGARPGARGDEEETTVTVLGIDPRRAQIGQLMRRRPHG